MGLMQELGEGVAPAPIADAVSALVNLGYGQPQAAGVWGPVGSEAPHQSPQITGTRPATSSSIDGSRPVSKATRSGSSPPAATGL